MNTKQLRQKILDLAIRGKLVPQNPEDEPAAVLLERVRMEKERLIKEKHIKRNKTDGVSPKKDAKLLYGQLPQGWELARLGNIAAIVTDGEHQTPKRCDAYCGYYLLSARNILNGEISLSNVDFVSEEEYAKISKRCNPQMGDILISCSGSVGRVAVVNDANNYVMVRSAAMVRPIFLEPFYMMFALQSEFLQEQINSQKKQVAQANLFQAEIRDLVLPVPPLAEQQRIVVAIESAFAVIDEIERNKADLQSAVIMAKQKILSLAIRGKLVPQDPEDEPAAVLLERVRAEKELIFKNGGVKRNKTESFLDESNYDQLPNNWVLTCLGELFNLQAGKFVQASDIASDNSRHKYPCYGGNGLRGYVSEFNRNGDYPLIGRQGALCGNINYATGQFYATEHAVVVECFSKTNPRWAYYFLEIMNLNQHATATAQPGLSVKTINEVAIPLPPLAEQKRIVAAIEAAFEQLDSISGNLV